MHTLVGSEVEKQWNEDETGESRRKQWYKINSSHPLHVTQGRKSTNSMEFAYKQFLIMNLSMSLMLSQPNSYREKVMLSVKEGIIKIVILSFRNSKSSLYYLLVSTGTA